MGGDNLDALCFAGQTVELPEALGLLEPEYVFLETGRVAPGTTRVFLGAHAVLGAHT